MSAPFHLVASILRTVAIIAGIWTALMLLFCIAWAGLMRMVREAERNLFVDAGEIERASGAQTVPPPAQNIIDPPARILLDEMDFPRDLRQQPARK